MGLVDRLRAARILAVLWHDPPWKPWGIGVDGGEIGGCSRQGGWDKCLLDEVLSLKEGWREGVE
ncbi:hypothetical protein apy_15640, partial [Aeropyrum pernix]